jgi:hypothetical protein
MTNYISAQEAYDERKRKLERARRKSRAAFAEAGYLSYPTSLLDEVKKKKKFSYKASVKGLPRKNAISHCGRTRKRTV